MTVVAMRAILAATIGATLTVIAVAMLVRTVHHCHEDEYQYVTSDGLACRPTDGGVARTIATDYEIEPAH